MAEGVMIFLFLPYLLLLLLSHLLLLRLLRNDQLVCDLAYRRKLLYGVLCHSLRLHSDYGRQKLLLLHLYIAKLRVVGDGDERVFEYLKGVGCGRA
jgi:hypothetical protein